MPVENKYNRRSFLSFVAKSSMAISPLVMIGATGDSFTNINTGDMNVIKQATNPSFGQLKQIDAGVLNVGYIDDGPADGPVVILLHGWPYDIYSYADVVPLLTSKGYRTIVPYLRGYGDCTNF